MTAYVALLRAVNVGGTGKLPMAELVAMCEAVGFEAVRTYIASGNAVFKSRLSEAEVKVALQERLAVYAGKPVGVTVRTAAEMRAAAAANPFPDRPGNRVVAIFLDAPPPPDLGVTHQTVEEIGVVGREIYVHYGDGMAASKLAIRAARSGTGRNLNTVAKLAEMAEALRDAGETD